MKIVDAPCGAGKTSYAIQMINESSDDKRFIFITPFLKEIDRIKEACSDKDFHKPDREGDLKNKSQSFKKLLTEGRNIVATHALFQIIDHEAVDLLRADNYTLILDEEISVIEEVKISKHDLQMLFNDGWLLYDSETGKVGASKDKYSGDFSWIMPMARMDRLVYVDNRLLLWEFPPEIFTGEVFEDIFILTYMFDGQIQKAYFDSHQIVPDYYTVASTGDGQYSLVHGLPLDYDKGFKLGLKNNIRLYDGRLNKIGEKKGALSRTWHKRPKNKPEIKKLKNNTYNFFRNMCDGSVDYRMWTTFKPIREKLKSDGVGETTFLAHNSRATNEYRHKKHLAYLIDKYPHQPILIYFRDCQGITLDNDMYALSELIQWLLRSQLRDGKPVDLYLPSKRMRTLLTNWMDS